MPFLFFISGPVGDIKGNIMHAYCSAKKMPLLMLSFRA